MRDLLNISRRLQQIASFIPKGSFFADIGSDHAYLPSYVCLQDKHTRAIAGEVNVGPLNRAMEVVETYELSHAIEVRLGDGLEVIEDEPVTCVVIAGMGGSLITSILEHGKQHLTSVKRLILQPNIDERPVRMWLRKNGYHLINEKIIEENGHYYEILVADQTPMKQDVYKDELLDKQLLFGPFLLGEKSDIFINKWTSVYDKLHRTIKQMKQAKDPNRKRIDSFEEELNWIEEVIKNDEKNKSWRGI